MKLMADKASIDTTRIIDLITSDISSPHKLAMQQGVNYYRALHDIYNHKNYYWIDSLKQEDKVKSNNTLPHPFHKILVDQKASYITGNPVVISISESDDNPEAETFNESLIEHLTEKFDDLVNDWVIGASNKSIEWVHFYIDKEGELKFLIVPAEQIIPVYDTQYQDRLIYVIRYYVVDVVSERGISESRYKVEWWSADDVEYWVQTESKNFIHDPEYDINPAPHWFSFNTSAPGIRSANAWGKVPFVPLWNNSELSTDLHPIKPLIDSYDKVKSGWLNDLEDFGEMIYVLKGFTGLSHETKAGYSQLAMFVENLRNNRAIGVETDGAVSTLRAEIPIEAKEKFLTITRKEIFYFGEGVDVSDENIGNSQSGIALKFLYTSLDLKANRMIRKLKSALKDFVWFVTQYINVTESKSYDADEIIFTINKAMVFNEQEKITSLVASKDMLSKQTILENHPYVDDINEELSRIESEYKKEKESENGEKKEMQTEEEITSDGNADDSTETETNNAL